MDQIQQYDMYGYGPSGPGTRTYKGGVAFHGHRPFYPPERREAHGHKSMVSPIANPYHGTHAGRRFLRGEVPNFQPGLGVSPLSNLCAAATPESLDNYCAYSRNFSSPGIANGFGLAGRVLQESITHESQDCGIMDLIQAGSEPISHPTQRYTDPISPHGSNTEWKPSVSPIGQMSISSNDALNLPSPEFPNTCANCGNHLHGTGVSVYYPDHGDVSSPMDWISQEAPNYILRPSDERVPPNRQIPIHGTRRIAPHNGRLDVPLLEQPKSRVSLQKSSAPNDRDNPVTNHAVKDGANNGLTKKRKRKPRTIKPRKPRTLTKEGKAHAKAVRESPGGACALCKLKKTKARDPTVTNLVFNTLITVPSALTSYKRTYLWSRMTS